MHIRASKLTQTRHSSKDFTRRGVCTLFLWCRGTKHHISVLGVQVVLVRFTNTRSPSFSLLPSALLSGTLRTFQRHACDQSSLALHCPAHTTIDVLYAHYGRPSLGTRQEAATSGAPPGSSSAPGGAGGMMRDEALPYDPCPPIPGRHEAPRPGVGCVLKEAGSVSTRG